MAAGRRARDHRLLDALGALEAETFAGGAWRVVRDGRDPLQGSNAQGRWSPGDFDVLYTSVEADGARAEVYFGLSRQPVFPSQLRYWLYGLKVRTSQTLRLANMAALRSLGVEDAHYRELYYDRTQAISDAARFMGFDGLIVPNARWDCLNLVLFVDAVDPEAIEVVDRTPIDWDAWRARKNT